MRDFFSEQEVEEALFQMHPLKSSGRDGLQALFFQIFWYIVRGDVEKVVLDSLNYEKDPREINHTFIALILKFKKSKNPKDFLPISLCNAVMNFFYKSHCQSH